MGLTHKTQSNGEGDNKFYGNILALTSCGAERRYVSWWCRLTDNSLPSVPCLWASPFATLIGYQITSRGREKQEISRP